VNPVNFAAFAIAIYALKEAHFFQKKNIYFEESNYELYAYLNIKNKPNEILKYVISL
jgi:hypothetical protein